MGGDDERGDRDSQRHGAHRADLGDEGCRDGTAQLDGQRCGKHEKHTEIHHSEFSVVRHTAAAAPLARWAAAPWSG